MERHICFIHIGMARDGAERVIAKLANKYAEKGYKVDIIVLLLDECGYDLHKNVHIESLVRNNKPRYKNICFWIKNIRKFIKKTNPEHVISFSMYVNIFTIISCWGLKKDILISERNDPSSDGRTRLACWLTQCLYPFASKIVFQTERAQKCFSEDIKKKSRIIVNPIDITCEATKFSSNKIVTIGRLEPQKNQELLIRAFSKIYHEYPNMELEIYGKGALHEKLLGMAVNLGIEKNVHFMGSVTDVHRRIQDAMMFVLSSDFEGLSNALLEAMLMGLPCISTNCAGSDEVIKNKDNGLITNVGDEIGLYEAMKLLIEDKELRISISKNAKLSAQRFRSEIVLNDWLEYIGDYEE